MTLRRRGVLSAVAAAALFVSSAVSGAPPPPPPAAFQQALQQSCQGRSVPTPVPTVPVTVTPLKPQAIVDAGKLRWRWGVRIASKDPRLSSIVGLELDDRYGLLAVTNDGNWISFDLQHGSLDAVKSVGIMPMVGAPGRPEALTTSFRSMLASFPDQHVVSLFGTDQCGAGASAVPLISVAGQPQVKAMTVAAYTYVGLAGQAKSGAVKNALLLPYQVQTVQLDRADLPGMAGYRLQALSNPSKIVPFIFTVWRRDGGTGETVIQQVHVAPWDDVSPPGPVPAPIELARLRRPIRALASFYDRSTRESWLFMAEEGGEPGGVVLYAFTSQSPDEMPKVTGRP
jgi:hypothetical protein